MAGEFEEGRPTRIRGTIIAELASEGFADAREIGGRASGVVYRRHQTSLGRTVAIKVLASDLAEANRQRFLREDHGDSDARPASCRGGRRGRHHRLLHRRRKPAHP